MESFDPFSEWLGRRGDRPPQDHYELLGLARFEPDLELIARTVDSLRTKIRKIRPGAQVGQWQRLLDRLEAAKICLNDPIAKAVYDESIDSTAHTLHVSEGRVVTDDTARNHGGPLPLPGEPVAIVRSAGRSAGTCGATSNHPEPLKAPPVVGIRGEDGDSTAGTNDSHTIPPLRPPRPKSGVPRLIARVLLVAIPLLMIAIGLAVLKQRPDLLEKVAGTWQRPDSPRVAPATTHAAPAETAEAIQESGPAERSTPAVEEVPQPPPAVDSGTPPPTPQQSAAVPLADPPAAVVPTPTASVSVDPARQLAFDRAIASARSALADRNLETAARQLNEAVSLAQTDRERTDAEQVEGLRAHVEAFWESLREQIGRLQSGSELRVGDTMVVVVEAGADFVILRVAGQNRRYSASGLPHVLAAAMAEQLFSNSANAKALRAAFLIVEPDGDVEKARQLLREASQGGAEVGELLAESNRPN
ncbi:MAG: hypothetical protein ACYC6Y_17115 [Thermoguttaceae bacterium]